MSDRLKNFLTDFVAGQEAVRRATAWIERTPDDKVPGRAIYRITGHTKAAVQGAISDRMAMAERHPNGGYAQFLTIWLNPDGLYEARGEVVLFAAECAA